MENFNARDKKEKFEYFSIEPDKYGEGFNVYGFKEYPDYSVLAGQTQKVFLDGFKTFEEAQKKYPQANDFSFTPEANVSHLPGEDDPVPGGMYPDDYLDENSNIPYVSLAEMFELDKKLNMSIDEQNIIFNKQQTEGVIMQKDQLVKIITENVMEALNENEKEKTDTMDCGFEIFTISEDLINQNWNDIMNDEKKDNEDYNKLYDEYADDDGKISQVGWDTLNNDINIFEKNLIKHIEDEYKIEMSDEGHDSDFSLIGSCWVDRKNKKAYDFVMEHHKEHGEASANEFVTELPLWDKLSNGMSNLGYWFLDGGIWFFDIDESEYEEWEDKN